MIGGGTEPDLRRGYKDRVGILFQAEEVEPDLEKFYEAPEKVPDEEDLDLEVDRYSSNLMPEVSISMHVQPSRKLNGALPITTWFTPLTHVAQGEKVGLWNGNWGFHPSSQVSFPHALI